MIDVRRVPRPDDPAAAISPGGLTTDNVVDFYCLLEREAVKKVIAEARQDAQATNFAANYKHAMDTAYEEVLHRLETLWGVRSATTEQDSGNGG